MIDENEFNVDFIGVGVEKSGSTWLAECLGEHPEIHVPKKKELYFFNDLDPHYFKYPSYNFRRGIDWYKTQFFDAEPAQLVGEFTPTYFFSEIAMSRILEMFPNTKLLLVIRNPVDRAFSQYVHNTRLGLISNISFEDALEKDYTYIEKGYYCKYLQQLFDIKGFKRENVGIYFYEDIKRDPESLLKSVYELLGVKNKDFIPEYIKSRKNSAAKPIFPWLNSFMIKTEYFLRDRKLDFLLNLTNDLGIRDLAIFLRDKNKVSYNKDTYPKINEGTRKALYEKFVEDIECLEDLLSVDLSRWKI